jgi:hypothetical protein
MSEIAYLDGPAGENTGAVIGWQSGGSISCSPGGRLLGVQPPGGVRTLGDGALRCQLPPPYLDQSASFGGFASGKTGGSSLNPPTGAAAFFDGAGGDAHITGRGPRPGHAVGLSPLSSYSSRVGNIFCVGDIGSGDGRACEVDGPD